MNKTKLLRKNGYPTKFGTILLLTNLHKGLCDMINPAQYYFGEEVGRKLMDTANAVNEILKVELPKYKKHE